MYNERSDAASKAQNNLESDDIDTSDNRVQLKRYHKLKLEEQSTRQMG